MSSPSRRPLQEEPRYRKKYPRRAQSATARTQSKRMGLGWVCMSGSSQQAGASAARASAPLFPHQLIGRAAAGAQEAERPDVVLLGRRGGPGGVRPFDLDLALDAV